LETEKIGDGNAKFSCDFCNYTCCCKSDYDKHISTAKHNRSMILNDLEQKKHQKTLKEYICNKCSKTYTARNSLWYHEKKCTPSAFNAEKNADDDGNNVNDKELIMTLLQQNNQLQNHIIELCKNNSITRKWFRSF
jgi:hypothetical protein